MTKIKFCGLSRRCDIEAVNELKPEYIGFVFVKTSKRYVSFEKAEELKSLLDPKIKAVGVFVNEDLKRIEEICDKKVIDIVQLHGLEEEKELNYLRSRILYKKGRRCQTSGKKSGGFYFIGFRCRNRKNF